MSAYVEASSTGIGSREATYHVTKFGSRKSWALTVSLPAQLNVAAYFRTENDARLFAHVFGLTITEHVVSAPDEVNEARP